VFVRQHEQLGIGHAVLTARDAIGREPFVLFFPDDVIVSDVPAARQLISVFEDRGGSVLALEEVPPEEVPNYGVVDGEAIAEGLYRVRGLVEKPSLADAPSNLAVVGRYVLTPEVFDALEETQPGKNGEIQITDGLAKLLTHQPMFGYRFEGRRYDTGRPLGLLKASIEVALNRSDLGPDLKTYLRSLDLGS
jgi:UTP--glucose-1-phosphate uridylyltransferase